jgi:hypothetical protein
MGKRWIQEEVDAIAEVRRRLKDEFAASPQFPEGNLLDIAVFSY